MRKFKSVHTIVVQFLASGALASGALASGALALAACGPAGDDGNGKANDGGTANSDAKQGLGPRVDAGPIADAYWRVDASCGAQSAEIPLTEISATPDLLIVLDKSGSMNDLIKFELTFPLPPTKWEVMEDALKRITDSYQGTIRFGLTSFPENGSVCGVASGADIDIALNNAGPINTWLGSHSPNDEAFTPAHLALNNAKSIYQNAETNLAGQYVLFATDGMPNCGGTPPVDGQASSNETLSAVQNLKTQGVNTFVLGFGDLFGLDPDLLNDAAQAGGEPKSGGPPYFYHANDEDSLDEALQAIAGGIVIPSCSFAVTETPPDPDLVSVSIDGQPVPRDPAHNSGWDYYPDDSTITFFGDDCDAVEAGNVDVSFVFGCPGPVID